MRQQDKRQEHEAADHCTIEQNGNDGIANNGLFFEDVIKAQQEG